MDNIYSAGILPPVLIPNVLIHLDRRTLRCCIVVNRQFHNAAIPFLWGTVDLSERQAITFMYTLATTDRFLGHWIQHLHLEGFALNDRLVLLVMRRTPSIVSVVLDNATQITDESMQYVSEYWRQIKSIQLTGSTMTHFDVFNTVQHLELWGCSGLLPTTFTTPFALESLIIDMHEPINLDLTGLGQLSDLRVYGGLGPASRGWPSCLRSVYVDEGMDWTDQAVLPLVRSCTHLTHLTLQEGTLTDLGLASIAMFLPNLTHLDLSSNDQLTARGIRQFVHQTQALQLLTLTYCGMSMNDFPEAGRHCASHVRSNRLNHLDSQALSRMR